MGTGHTIAEAAETLAMAPSTVQTHLHNIALKLHTHNVRESYDVAMRQGLLDPPTGAE